MPDWQRSFLRISSVFRGPACPGYSHVGRTVQYSRVQVGRTVPCEINCLLLGNTAWRQAKRKLENHSEIVHTSLYGEVEGSVLKIGHILTF